MIKVLDKQIADKIAAGEVIERPVSIVKELVENSIDAGADSITVEIKNGGKTYIRITDNGSGISQDEVETAFLRHATSKISTVKDLDAIDTLGFRGEALASIAAVTRTELITKTHDSKTGTKLVIQGGTVISKEATGCPDGTTIIISDLFYNTPARLKFMKSDSVESSLIIQLISEISLAYKDVKIRLINNGRILFSTLGDGNRMNTIIRVFSDVDPKNMVEVHYEDRGIQLEGYISTPAMSKTTRSSQIFFVNGRVIKSKVIEKGVTLGYKERLFEGRFPIAFLFLKVDSSTLDVNIHPNKREIRFDDENLVSEFVSEGIMAALATKDAVVDAGNLFNNKEIKPLSGLKVFEKVFDMGKSTPEELRKNTEAIGNVNDKATPSGKVTPSNAAASNTASMQQVTLESAETTSVGAKPTVKKATSMKSAYEKVDTEKTEQLDIKSLLSTIDNKPLESATLKSDATSNQESVMEKTKVQPVLEDIVIYEPKLKPFDFEDLSVIGVLFDTYIMCTDYNNFYLFDQHAAHERIRYEELVAEYDAKEKSSQTLLLPIITNVSLAFNEEKHNWIKPLEKMGFIIEEFGASTYRISEIPMFMEFDEAEKFVELFIENIGNSTDLRNTVVINKLIMMSCKEAIKANDRLDPSEVNALIKRLALCRNPFSCPHGRPTFIKLSKYEIEKMFKRV